MKPENPLSPKHNDKDHAAGSRNADQAMTGRVVAVSGFATRAVPADCADVVLFHSPDTYFADHNPHPLVAGLPINVNPSGTDTGMTGTDRAAVGRDNGNALPSPAAMTPMTQSLCVTAKAKPTTMKGFTMRKSILFSNGRHSAGNSSETPNNSHSIADANSAADIAAAIGKPVDPETLPLIQLEDLPPEQTITASSPDSITDDDGGSFLDELSPEEKNIVLHSMSDFEEDVYM